ncbi:hypothetical protein J3R83DRAFT_288 [Lanmaoa asiatica]|nr:hypothetical protein J3R83DRAFT_288 [Lanmaoa asiatica]
MCALSNSSQMCRLKCARYHLKVQFDRHTPEPIYAGLEKRLGPVSVPDLDATFGEEGKVCLSADEPKELFDDASEVGAFGDEEGEGGIGE